MNKPIGELAIQTLAMPADTNANGDIFGGWLVSQMDLAAGILAKRVAKARVATVAIKSMNFLKPLQVGNVLSCYVSLEKIGNTSMTVRVEAWGEDIQFDKIYLITHGTFIFVALDAGGNPQPVRR